MKRRERRAQAILRSATANESAKRSDRSSALRAVQYSTCCAVLCCTVHVQHRYNTSTCTHCICNFGEVQCARMAARAATRAASPMGHYCAQLNPISRYRRAPLFGSVGENQSTAAPRCRRPLLSSPLRPTRPLGQRTKRALQLGFRRSFANPNPTNACSMCGASRAPKIVAALHYTSAASKTNLIEQSNRYGRSIDQSINQ